MRRPRGFTLLELLIAMSVSLPLLLVGLTFFRSQTRALGQGEIHMELARETALVSRVLYTELKSIHAPLVLDPRFDLWVDGEREGRPLPNRVVVDPGGHGLRYWVYPLSDPGSRVEKRISSDSGSLVVRTGQEIRRIGRRLASLAFAPVAGDPDAVQVRFEVVIPAAPGTPPSRQSADILVRLEGANTVVR